MAKTAQIPLAATGDVLMHRAHRRRLADILTCIRTRRTIETLGRLAQPNAERRLRPPAEMARIFAAHPQALARTMEIANRCTFSLDELAYEYPGEGNGEPPQARLERLARAGLDWRYPEGASEKAKNLVTRELALIARLNYAPYFLTVHDIVAFARSRGILCQGRGSAANSVVCYALGVTEIAPETISMVFERFVSEARDEPPDIDVDFEHERREEVIQHIYRKYGRHRAGLCATVIHFRSRAALREVGRAMGLSADITAALAGQVWGWSLEARAPERLRKIGLDPTDRRLVQTMELVGQVIGFPGHPSQDCGRFVTTARRVAPIGALTVGPISRDTNISQIYLEYGLLDGLTIGAKSYIELSTTDLTTSSAALGGFVRKRVWQDGRGGVASVQFGYAHPIESLLGDAFAMAEPGAVPEAPLAGLYGRGWAGDWGAAFPSPGPPCCPPPGAHAWPWATPCYGIAPGRRCCCRASCRSAMWMPTTSNPASARTCPTPSPGTTPNPCRRRSPGSNASLSWRG